MLKLKDIVKTYKVGDNGQNALDGVDICFRESEFVSILGQSGSGKTTLLNIIGGLDRYTSGDLLINGISTKKYTDGDWDRYRNDSVGFVFQSYNLIPHQTVLANVEMALTLAGVSKRERKRRAVAVLKKVGLEAHLYKKPNQMSGGQMQRVAIARAIINDPDILLADEPTGALDSETSIQIMELLKEIAKDKLVIMVTHNPELAEKYSTRIVKLKDGKITDDSNPYDGKNECERIEKTRKKKISMSFSTALSLSFDNLKTKKGRTILTSTAGSIGIIGIALIFALSTGMNTYIEDVQKETMTSYPITISAETIDISSIMGVRGEIIGSMRDNEAKNADDNSVYADYTDIKTSQMVTSSIVENNLTEFKKYLDDPNSEIHKYIGENGIVYIYDVDFNVYSFDKNGKLVSDSSNSDKIAPNNGNVGIIGKLNGSEGSAADFSEIASGTGENGISKIVTDNYELLSGEWCQNYDETVIVLDKDNSISAGTLRKLGLITEEQYEKASKMIKDGKNADEIKISFDDIKKHKFYLVCACDMYTEDENGIFSRLDDSVINCDVLLENAIELKIVGIVRAKDGVKNADISTTVAYTSQLTDHIIKHTNESKVVKAQENDPSINVCTGMKFASTDNETKIADSKKYLSNLGISGKASFYKLFMYYASDVANNDMMLTDESTMAAALDAWLAGSPNEEILLGVYDEYIAGGSYEDNMKAFGKVGYDAPSSISLYTDSFENKDKLADCIKAYNENAEENAKITYTDYVAMLTSSLTTIIDGISYVLVAFVSISLIVSCIMIGIITHISVMERTKEIGILRALGASKANISQVFNAETFIIGCLSGTIGIGVSLIALLPINSVIEKLTGIHGLNARLPVQYCLSLVALSIVITVIGGSLPAKNAAKKDPVIALRTE